MNRNPSRALAAVAIVTAALAGCAGSNRTNAVARVSDSVVSTAPSTTVSVPPSPSPPSTSTGPVASEVPAPAVTAGVALSLARPRPTTTTAKVRPPVTTTTVPSTGGPTIAGCPLFPADNPWRQDVSHLPVDPHSAAWVASIGVATHVHPDFGSDPSYGIPYVVVPASQPKVPITFTAYGSESDPGPYPAPPSAPIEAGSDGHVLVASGDCHLYELYNAAPDGRGGWNAGSGAVFDLRSDKLRPDTWTSADAAGLPILPGLVRWDEVQAGHIDHALRFTVSRTQRGFIHPATHQAGSSTDPNLPPMGARFRLSPSFDISKFNGAARVVLQALQRYGMFVADNGSNWFISGSTDTRWNDSDLNQLKSIPGSAFEAVATGPILH